MRVAAVQFDIAWEDKRANHAMLDRLLDESHLAPGTFILLPEMTDTGFSFNLDRTVDDMSLAWAQSTAKRLTCWIQMGYPQRDPTDNFGRNCAAIIDPSGEVRGVYRKVFPFSFGREIEHFRGGDEILIVDVDGVAVCPLICYDLRFPELWRLAARAGAEVFTIGASWPAARHEHWRTLLAARAIENQAAVIACNRIGSDPHLPYAGGSTIIAPRGERIIEAGNDETRIITSTIDIDDLRAWRETFPALRDIRDDFLGSIGVVRNTR